MNIFRILINQNPVWGVSGFSCFFILLTVVIIYEHYMYINTKVSFKQMIAKILLFIYLWTVLESTVFTRVPQAHPQYELQVFWSWKAIFHYHDRELLKENILNCMLLMPYGCMISVAVGKRISWKKGLLIGMATSAVIEVLQLITCRGLFEIDDIIHNGVGCMIGVILISRCYRISLE